MPRITADLIARSPQFLNPVRERELCLRRNRIPTIENLGVCQDAFDTIDLSENDIVRLENFPMMRRLHTLLLSTNQISKSSASLGESLPNLQVLVLTNNRFSNLQDLDPLASFPRLRSLSLIDNPVCKRPNYRLYVIQNLPNLKLLDFQKIKQKEREAALKLFGSKKQAASSSIPAAADAGSKTFVPGEELPRSLGGKAPESALPQELTPEQTNMLKEAIMNAQSLDEVAELERALKQGKMPESLARKILEKSQMDTA